jgi:hypothetical protein
MQIKLTVHITDFFSFYKYLLMYISSMTDSPYDTFWSQSFIFLSWRSQTFHFCPTYVNSQQYCCACDYLAWWDSNPDPEGDAMTSMPRCHVRVGNSSLSPYSFLTTLNAYNHALNRAPLPNYVPISLANNRPNPQGA